MTKAVEFRRVAERCLAILDPSYRIRWSSNAKYSWDGKGTLNIDRAVDNFSYLHDVAHAFVAPPKRRRLPEFGLGPGPFISSDADAPRVISRSSADREEARACSLHWALIVYFHGAEHAQEVEEYVSMPCPAFPRTIRTFAKYNIAPDFVPKVLEIREEIVRARRAERWDTYRSGRRYIDHVLRSSEKGDVHQA